MSPLPRAIARASREPPDSDETLLLNPRRAQHSMQTRARDYSRGTRVVRETRPARTRTAPRRLRRGGPRMNPRPFPRANRPRAQLVAPHPGRLRRTKPRTSFALLDHSAETTLFGSVKAKINRGFAVQRESERRWAHHTVCSADLARSDWTCGKNTPALWQKVRIWHGNAVPNRSVCP